MSDVSRSTEDLLRRQELLTREIEAHQHSLDDYRTIARTTQGTGTAADGAITAVVDAQHRLVDLAIEPPALRLGSIGALRDALMAAINDAHDDVDANLAHELGDTGVADFMDSMPEVVALLPDDVVARLRERPDPEPQRAPQHALSWSDWSLDD